MKKVKLSNLTKEDEVKKSNYIPSNDSEVIARLLSGFQYNSNKTEEVLSKYDN